MDDGNEVWIGFIGFMVALVTVIGSAYGCYRYGKFAERRLLTQYFAQMTSDTYEDGFKEGLAKGKLSVICPDEEEYDGRY